jgi:DegV family protein with EDD domain
MRQVSLLTDSTAGISGNLAAELGVTLVPTSYAFAEERFLDSETDWPDFYRRMLADRVSARTFGVPEASWRKAFEDALETSEAVISLVTPFDVSPSFTTAVAAMLAIRDERPEVRIKVVSPGTASAGLGALVMSLAGVVGEGANLEATMSAIEDLEPSCDSLFVPRTIEWLQQAGRLALLEERLGPIDSGVPIVRTGTRLMGVALAGNQEEGIQHAIEMVGKRAPNARAFNASVVHADAAGCAEGAAARLGARWPLASVSITDLSATYGTQLGPGTVGIGLCQLPERKD